MGSAIGAAVVLGVRLYVLDMCVKSFKFGCDTAALKTERYYDADIGQRLYIFCKAYTGNMEKEFFGGKR